MQNHPKLRNSFVMRLHPFRPVYRLCLEWRALLRQCRGYAYRWDTASRLQPRPWRPDSVRHRRLRRSWSSAVREVVIVEPELAAYEKYAGITRAGRQCFYRCPSNASRSQDDVWEYASANRLLAKL